LNHFKVTIYGWSLQLGRLSLNWQGPWAWYEFNLKSYIWAYLPDDEYFWGRIIGLEYCWYKDEY